MGLLDEINQSEGYIKYEKGTDELILIFSHINYPAGKFTMSNAMAGQPASKLYINCSDNSWYQAGIPGYTKNIADTIVFLKRVISEINPTKTITCGMSMGGYGALLYGIVLELDYVLAFTAELDIGFKHQRSFYLNKLRNYDSNYKSINTLINHNKKTDIHLFYGAYDMIDLHGLDSIRPAIKNPKLNLYLVSGDHKATLRFDIPLMVSETLKNGKPPMNELVLMKDLQEEDLKYYKAIQDKVSDLDFHYRAFHKKKQHYSQDIFFYGKACLDLKRFNEALDAFLNVIKIDPNFPLGYHLAGLTLNALKRYDEAVVMYKKAIEIDPELAGIYFRLGQTQMILKDYDEAGKNLEKSVELDSTIADAWFILGSLYEIKMIRCFESSVRRAPEQERFKQKLKSVKL